MATTFVKMANRVEPAQSDKTGTVLVGASLHNTDDESEPKEEWKPMSRMSRGKGGEPESPTKHRWYYALAQGCIPGVYTDWGNGGRPKDK
jgi:hypothetical protein